ncbi:glycosyltransferase [bacterium]|nr:glycosyltransferase [bacterium]
MTKGKPRVSIGLPVYNGEKYLKPTLDSILCQTFTDFELIISDNGSNDRTKEMCEEYAANDKRIIYHRNINNLGIAPNYNLVFELSSGDYFKWADYDDILSPNFLAECLEVLDNNPDVAVCFSKIKLINKDGEFIEEYDPLPETVGLEPHKRFRNLILEPDHVAAQVSGLMRANIIKESIMHGSYPSSDEVILANLALLGEFYEIPERLMSIRFHPEQSTSGVLASERARVISFDTSLKGQVILIKWLYFKDCILSIKGAPISAYQKILCYLHMLHWLLLPKNFRSMVKDMLLAIHQRIPIFPKLYQETLDAPYKF